MSSVSDTSTSTTRLTKFYGEMSPSLDTVLSALVAAGVDTDHVQASDLYRRDLDCHNLGMHRMLEVLKDVAEEYGRPVPEDTLLDLGCGLGGPGRFLVDQFGCSVVGVDLLPLRVELAQALTDLTRMGEQISYRVADATNLGVEGRVLRRRFGCSTSACTSATSKRSSARSHACCDPTDYS